MLLFALNGSRELGTRVADELGIELARCEEREFEDGEHKIRPLDSVRGKDIQVLHSLNGTGLASANDKLVRLLFFLATARENGARSVTAIAPYLAYSRKDRQTKFRDPVTTRYVAQLFEAAGADRVITLDVHNYAAFQNAFRCATIHLSARQVFCGLVDELAAGLPVAVFSPDGGGVKRAQLLKEAVEARGGNETGFGFMEKRRSRGVVSGELFAGEVEGRAVFIVDDIIASGGTMLRAAGACRRRGARAVYALATHGLFAEGSEGFLAASEFDGIVVTDSVGAAMQAKSAHPQAKLTIASVGPLIADAIRRLDGSAPLSDLSGLED